MLAEATTGLKALGVPKQVMGAVGGTAVAAGVARGITGSVPKNHAGVKLRWNRTERIRGPRKGVKYGQVSAGWHLQLPGVDKIVHTTLEDRPDQLPSFKIDINGTQYVIDGFMTWRVLDCDDNLYRALFKNDGESGLRERILKIGGKALFQVMNSKSSLEHISDYSSIEREALAEAYAPALENGVEVAELTPIKHERSEAEVLGSRLVDAASIQSAPSLNFLMRAAVVLDGQPHDPPGSLHVA